MGANADAHPRVARRWRNGLSIIFEAAHMKVSSVNRLSMYDALNPQAPKLLRGVVVTRDSGL